ncbi:hypothetical protein L3Q82_000643 [Scortum barcoo]|uniref:Uncharacterized protein n=1 Tax=Scortum barcoo TaxID=214431 RepID=A0ACB8WFP7_9TELE|nr:hypothetical protein L3Q82_000643 [Scortum barcoo]
MDERGYFSLLILSQQGLLGWTEKWAPVGSSSRVHPPKVQVYSRNPGEFGTANILICHTSNFHPPDIEIKLMKDEVEIPNANQTDLAFKQDWRFHVTKSVTITPQKGEKYTCKVTHGRNTKVYAWAAPEVQVYSREPGDFNKLNTLICYVRNFHPPEIRIELLKNGQEIREARQTDLAFEENWHYHLTKHVPFIPKSGDKYTCRVTHMGNTKVYEWGEYGYVADMN